MQEHTGEIRDLKDIAENERKHYTDLTKDEFENLQHLSAKDRPAELAFSRESTKAFGNNKIFANYWFKKGFNAARKCE